MYSYYSRAEVCIAYLADVVQESAEQDEQSKARAICRSRWMTRGWCLQELIAPKRIEFYDSGSRKIADISAVLARHVEGDIGIPSSIMLKTSLPSDWSVAQRMSWASQRETTRVEDKAYCLLGLFRVNLPLIYGEGKRAFARLQEEIIKSSTDHSIFAWTFGPSASAFASKRIMIEVHRPSIGLWLAPSPAYFCDSGHVVQCYTDLAGWVASYEMTNLGLGISLPLVPCSSYSGIFHAVLNCSFRDVLKGPIALNVKKAITGRRQNTNEFHTKAAIFDVCNLDAIEPRDSRYLGDCCVADHCGRLAIVEEEDLIDQARWRITILRSQDRSRTSSLTGWRPSHTSRLKLKISKPTFLSSMIRTAAIPEADWDRDSPIWVMNGSWGIISFDATQFGSQITFIFRAGTDPSKPIHFKVLESLSPVPLDCERLSQLHSPHTAPDSVVQKSADSKSLAKSMTGLDRLQIGQTDTYGLHSTTLAVKIDRRNLVECQLRSVCV